MEKMLQERERSEKQIPAKKGFRYFCYIFFKRFFDICVGFLGCVFVLLAVPFVFIGNLFCRDVGNVFYKQKRVGKDGRIFYVYKFRSMVKNADAVLSTYLAENPAARVEFEEFHKLKNDPRITKNGKILRATSIDELPQFINVLFGSMSFIGPRPYLDWELAKDGKDHTVLLSVRPGLTGYWQVNGRSQVEYDDRMKMEVWYAENRSFLLDVKIFFKTFVAVFKKDGAE